ncbi:MAG: GNAT family N-acetyltransferase [Gammaproteobacteria bacterium]
MHVFAAEIDHLEPLSQLFDRYRQFYGRPSDLSLAENFVKARLLAGDTRFFLATVGDNEETRKAAGFTQLFPSFSSVSASSILILNDLYVDHSQRQKGVGRALMRAARDYARDSGCAGIKLETQKTNTIGQALYESEGYVRLTGFYQYFLDTPQSESWLKRWV